MMLMKYLQNRLVLRNFQKLAGGVQSDEARTLLLTNDRIGTECLEVHIGVRQMGRSVKYGMHQTRRPATIYVSLCIEMS